MSRTQLHDDDDESPEDDFEGLLVVFGVSGLVIVALVACITLFLILF